MKPRQLAIVLCLLGCGCASEAPSADAPCTDTNGLLQGAVVGDYPWGDGDKRNELSPLHALDSHITQSEEVDAPIGDVHQPT